MKAEKYSKQKKQNINILHLSHDEVHHRAEKVGVCGEAGHMGPCMAPGAAGRYSLSMDAELLL